MVETDERARRVLGRSMKASEERLTRTMDQHTATKMEGGPKGPAPSSSYEE